MKRFRKTIILSMLLALTLCIGAQATENTMLKVGLKYGTNALFTARLQNYNDTLSGSGVALVTPMTPDGIDFPALEQLIEWHIASGTDALILCATTGEGATLT